MQKVLVLGAGLVSKPMVVYLLEHGFQVTVASRTVSKAEALIEGHENGKAIPWTVDKEDELKQMVAEHDLSVSLLPPAYHVMVAKACLENNKPMVTTSYVSPEMKALDGEAKSKNLDEVAHLLEKAARMTEEISKVFNTAAGSLKSS